MAENSYADAWKNLGKTDYSQAFSPEFQNSVVGQDIFRNVFGSSQPYSFDSTRTTEFSPQVYKPQSDAPSWMDFGKAALDIASRWKSPTGTTTQRSSDGRAISAPGAEVTDLGSGYKMIRPAPKISQRTTQGGGGFLGPALSLVGMGAGAMLAGPAGAMAAASLGGNIGGTVGGLADRALYG